VLQFDEAKRLQELEAGDVRRGSKRRLDGVEAGLPALFPEKRRDASPFGVDPSRRGCARAGVRPRPGILLVAHIRCRPQLARGGYG
jgi:hypothetical protein